MKTSQLFYFRDSRCFSELERSHTPYPEQRSTVKQCVVKQKVRPSAEQSELCASRMLSSHPVLGTCGPTLRLYRYVYADDEVVLVDPSSRRVVKLND